MPFAAERDILVRVEEGRSQRVTFGLGYDSEDGARALLGYSHSNLGGRAVSTRFDLRVSEREEQFRALLRQPFLGRWQIPMTYSLFAVEEEKESFDSKRRGAQVEGHWQRAASRFGLLYTYKIVDVIERPDEPLFTLDIDRNLQESEISSLTPSVLLDHRDDPLIPTSGWTLNLQSEVAFPLFSADTRYLKLFGQNTLYRSLGALGVVAGSLRLGAIEPIDAKPEDVESLVPISEQFFAGGRTTHRAYPRDLLGVAGETVLLCRSGTTICAGEIPEGESPDDYRRVAVGGNGLFVFNLDYRFPLAESLGGTVFVDAGNVWADWQDIDLGEVKFGAGVGLRYLSPIGPLRLEVGWTLDREVGEIPSVIFLSFGNPFYPDLSPQPSVPKETPGHSRQGHSGCSKRGSSIGHPLVAVIVRALPARSERLKRRPGVRQVGVENSAIGAGRPRARKKGTVGGASVRKGLQSRSPYCCSIHSR
jgi:outer membrane protein assembly factor BamA